MRSLYELNQPSPNYIKVKNDIQKDCEVFAKAYEK